MPVVAVTAEWNCTRCGATNRRLVATDTTRSVDRCVTCHATHIIELADRPVRWSARLKAS